jgi:nitroreductase
MEAIECIKTRRSIRKFTSTPVPDEIIADIIDCAQKAPSANNTQPWAFIVVKDEHKRKLLSKVQSYCSFIEQAPVCIVACLTPGEDLFPPARYLSIACAVENILLSAHAYGLAGCWTYVKDLNNSTVENKVKEILNIPKDVEVICLVPIGYPDQEVRGRNLKKREEILHNDQW